jgi:hypothetical protein
MTFNQSNLLSGRVPVTDYADLTADRYQFLSVNQAEPNLGPGANSTILTITTNNTRVWSNSFSVTGNIGGNYVFGNGAFLTGVTGSGNSVVSNQTISGDGSTIAYTLDVASTDNSVFVTTNGVAQAPGVDYTVAGTTITFTTPPAVGDIMQIRFLTNNLVTVTTSYNDANVAAFLPTYSGTLTASGISTTGNVTANSFLTTANLKIGINPDIVVVGDHSEIKVFGSADSLQVGWEDSTPGSGQIAYIQFNDYYGGIQLVTGNVLGAQHGLIVFENGNVAMDGDIYVEGNIQSNGIITSQVYTVSTLPAANAAGAGARAFVSNANTVTFYNVVGTGGSNTVPVFSDGTDWRVG